MRTGPYSDCGVDDSPYIILLSVVVLLSLGKQAPKCRQKHAVSGLILLISCDPACA